MDYMMKPSSKTIDHSTMFDSTIHFHPIGIIHTPFEDLAGMPIQPTSDASAAGTLEIFPEFVPGLKDLDGFSHLILLYHLHQAGPANLEVTPFLDSQPHGVFATRAPTRPNPIGLSVVRLTGIERNILYVEDLDILDGTPLLDIKPYIPEFDFQPEVRIGWLEQVKGNVKQITSDNRFK
jgi:tRNA (adenine37-N6)-methyltransferase